MGKTYTLKNGYKIAVIEAYNGYEMVKSWGIWKPDGSLYLSCGTYQEAYELASHLVEEDN